MPLQSASKTLLFVDLDAFIEVVKDLDTAAIARLLERLYDIVGDVVTEQGGRIVQYVGDGIMAAFPRGMEDHAVAAACEVAWATRELGSELPTRLKPQIAIHTCDVMEGEIGHKSLRVNALVGHGVCLVAILAHKKAGAVLLTDETRRSLREPTVLNEMGVLSVPWQVENIPIWEIDWEEEAARAADAQEREERGGAPGANDGPAGAAPGKP